jgi:toxin ParE1/3/4
MRVHWTDNAVEHLVNICEYIASNSPTYAQNMVDKITRRSVQIAAQLLSGRKVAEYDAMDVRELIEPPYRIIYRIKQDQIDVLAVMHGCFRMNYNFLLFPADQSILPSLAHFGDLANAQKIKTYVANMLRDALSPALQPRCRFRLARLYSGYIGCERYHRRVRLEERRFYRSRPIS